MPPKTILLLVFGANVVLLEVLFTESDAAGVTLSPTVNPNADVAGVPRFMVLLAIVVIVGVVYTDTV